MLDETDERFRIITKIFKQNGSSVKMVEKAYLMARLLHKNQKRKDGQPYIVHPVEVAIILANLGFDEDVVSAGLLHDVVEDCGYTLGQIASEFNQNVAELVDCVSAIDKAKYVQDENDIYEIESFEKASIEEQSFKKLIAIGKKNPLGFFIKFADRLHNLRTISTFEFPKQLEKVRETEKWILPIAKILQAKYFYDEMKNECFKIAHQFDIENFFYQYDNYFLINSKYIDYMKYSLNKNIIENGTISFDIQPLSEYKIYESIINDCGKVNFSKVDQSIIQKVPTYDVFITYQNMEKLSIIKNIVSELSGSAYQLKIIDIGTDSFTKAPYFLIKDAFDNIFRIFYGTNNEFISQQLGTLDGRLSTYIDDDNMDNLDVELMRVKTRSGEVKYVQKDSTVLDFAFKIHKEIGFGFKYAIINNGKTKFPPYTKLYEGDQVRIVVERDENEQIINNASLNWLAYVNTDLAKKLLIKHFQKLLNKTDN